MLEEKLIIVTGGAGRLGSTFCKSILENSGKVIICDSSDEKGTSLERKLSDSRAKFIKADITKKMDFRKNNKNDLFLLQELFTKNCVQRR